MRRGNQWKGNTDFPGGKEDWTIAAGSAGAGQCFLADVEEEQGCR